MASTYTVYWQPGCTSCLRTKEFLRSHGIEFETVNVRETPGATDALASLGIRSVPAVVRGTTFVLGQDLDEVARFVGVALERERLPIDVLAARLLRLLDCAAAFTRRIPDRALGTALPGRKRTYLDLAYHVPQVVVAMLDASEGGCLTYEHFNRKPPGRLRTAAEAAVVTEQVARSFGAWWAANAGKPPAVVDTYYGPQPFHAALERTTWHVAQHLRQIERVLGLLDAGLPDAGIPPGLLSGLPLPEDVWDAEVPLG
jgi:glutaredoxin